MKHLPLLAPLLLCGLVGASSLTLTGQQGPLLPGSPTSAPVRGLALHPFELKEESVRIEATTTGEANLVVEAEAELGLRRLELRSPDGEQAAVLGTRNTVGLTLQGFVLEGEEGTLQEIRDRFAEGTYQLVGTTTDGRPVEGRARLEHGLPQPVSFVFPYDGATDVPVVASWVLWTPSPDAVRQRLTLEQDDADTLSVLLAPDVAAFRIPNGLLAPGTESFLEIGVEGANGNVLTSEITFETH